MDASPPNNENLNRSSNSTDSQESLLAKSESLETSVPIPSVAPFSQVLQKLDSFFAVLGRRIEHISFGIISGTVGVFSTLVIYILHLKLGWHPMEAALLDLCAITLSFLIEALAKWRRALNKYKELRPLGDRLLDLNRALPPQLGSYVHMSVRKKIESLIDLSTRRPSDCTYPDQIAIATSLVRGATKRFWATSTDRPSVLWAEGISYFNIQADLQIAISSQKSGPPGKARLVMLSFEDLFEDYSDNVSSQGFTKFVKWHVDNNFALRFYLVHPNEDLREKIKRTVDEADPLKDFLIKDHDFVYGRIDTLGGSGVRLKFVPRQPDTDMDAFNAYQRLFIDLWEQSDDRQRVLGLLDFERGKRARQEQVRRDYKSEFLEAPSGESFFKEMLRRIREAKKTLYAVDIADKKGSISNWSFQPEYKYWLEACIQATKKGNVDAKRIFIVGAFGALVDFDLQQVLKQQLEAGFEIILIDDDAVAAGELHVDDFLLIDDGLGFTLGPDSSNTFTQDALEFSKNLIPKNSLETYRKKFDELLKHGTHFAGRADIGKLESFLQNVGSSPTETTT